MIPSGSGSSSNAEPDALPPEAAWVGLVNPKSPTNVGSVLRAAGCFSAAGIYYTGNRFHRAREFVSDTRDDHERIPLTHCEELAGAPPVACAVVAVELVEGAVPLMAFEHPARALYVFGPEDGSLPPALVRQADHVVYVPTEGCLNLAASVNIVLYDRLAKSGRADLGVDLIRRSRDNNNRLRVSVQAGQPPSPAGDPA
jgi:tRNA(Leu) C34 or U34 (ribose-2'-O)-methylase TrmL